MQRLLDHSASARVVKGDEYNQESLSPLSPPGIDATDC